MTKVNLVVEKKIKEIISSLAMTLSICDDTRDRYALTRSIIDLNSMLYRHENYEKE